MNNGSHDFLDVKGVACNDEPTENPTLALPLNSTELMFWSLQPTAFQLLFSLIALIALFPAAAAAEKAVNTHYALPAQHQTADR